MAEQGRFARLLDRVKAWRTEYGPEEAAAYLRERCGGEAGQVIEAAGRLMDQTFVFTDPWDMEPCGEPYTFPEMRWNEAPNGDPEWVYMLNRHDSLQKLLQAWRLTGDEAYAGKLKWYLFHWMEHNPLIPGGETVRTIDTGIRCMNWTMFLLFLLDGGLVSEEETERVLAGMGDQFQYLREAYIGKYTLSNWGLLQTTAMCAAYCWFEEYLPGGGLKEWAWKELEMQLELQVGDDGSHWEQSIMYHMEVLNSCMKLWAVCRFAGEETPGWLRRTVERMSRYVLFAAGPDHRQLAQADSDVTDVRDVLTKAAVLCGSPELKGGGYKALDLDSCWLLGSWGLRVYENLSEGRPAETSLVCGDTGNIYLRSGWEEDAHYTYLHCGPLGSSHGHGDLTQICLYFEGRPFLVDSGRYSYREDEPLRVKFKEAGAHNVCTIDGASQARAEGSWSYRSYGEAFRNSCREKGPLHFAELAYHGLTEQGRPCLVKRKVAVHDSGFWLIVNDICCEGSHRVEECYHLDGSVRAERDAQAEAGAGEVPRWRLLSGGVRLNLWGQQDFSLEPCWVSPRYNCLEKSGRLTGVRSFEDRFTGWTAFAGDGIRVKSVPVQRAGDSREVGEETVTAVEFLLGERESWIILIWNREICRGTKLLICRGVPVYGRAVALHVRDGELCERLRL